MRRSPLNLHLLVLGRTLAVINSRCASLYFALFYLLYIYALNADSSRLFMPSRAYKCTHASKINFSILNKELIKYTKNEKMHPPHLFLISSSSSRNEKTRVIFLKTHEDSFYHFSLVGLYEEQMSRSDIFTTRGSMNGSIYLRIPFYSPFIAGAKARNYTLKGRDDSIQSMPWKNVKSPIAPFFLTSFVWRLN